MRLICVVYKDNLPLFHFNICELFIFNLSYCSGLKIESGAVWTVSVFVLTETHVNPGADQHGPKG